MQSLKLKFKILVTLVVCILYFIVIGLVEFYTNNIVSECYGGTPLIENSLRKMIKERTDSIFNIKEVTSTTTNFKWPSDILIDTQQGISHDYTT